MKSKVDVFIVGAQKAGTTSLYDWLGQHPDIDAPQQVKDYHFFTDEDLFSKGYLHFDSFYRGRKDISIHCAVNYLYFYEKAAERLYKYNPEAKVIVCLRDPVARAISAYKYFVKTLRENRSFSKALEEEISGELKTYAQLSDHTYIGHGRYAEQIKGFKRFFPSGQIHYVLFDNIVSTDRRDEEMNKVLDFIRLSRAPVNFRYHHLNKSGRPRSPFLNKLVRRSFIRKWAAAVLPRKIRKKVLAFIVELNTSSKNLDVDITRADVSVLNDKLGLSYKEVAEETGLDVCKMWG